MGFDELGKRMKEKYEKAYNIRLTCRTPVILRIDGKAFHTFTKKFDKPFDNILATTMQETMKVLCKEIESCVFGYTQSDEISLLLIDYTNFETCPWFDYKIQKVTSIASSITTLHFNRIFYNILYENSDILENSDKLNMYMKAYNKGALFDTRCFNIPKEEVNNYFYWRQTDAIRNSIEMAGHANFSDKQLYKKTTKQIKEMLKEKNFIWDDLPTKYKQGSCCYKIVDPIQPEGAKRLRRSWIIDQDIPNFSQDKEYIEQWILKEDK